MVVFQKESMLTLNMTIVNRPLAKVVASPYNFII